MAQPASRLTIVLDAHEQTKGDQLASYTLFLSTRISQRAETTPAVCAPLASCAVCCYSFLFLPSNFKWKLGLYSAEPIQSSI